MDGLVFISTPPQKIKDLHIFCLFRKRKTFSCCLLHKNLKCFIYFSRLEARELAKNNFLASHPLCGGGKYFSLEFDIGRDFWCWYRNNHKTFFFPRLSKYIWYNSKESYTPNVVEINQPDQKRKKIWTTEIDVDGLDCDDAAGRRRTRSF